MNLVKNEKNKEKPKEISLPLLLTFYMRKCTAESLKRLTKDHLRR